jgi:cell division protein FtsQ
MIGADRHRTAVSDPGPSAVPRRRPGTAPRSRRRRLPRPGRWGLRILVGVVAALAVAAGAWVWLRNSSLVAVQRVTIVGVSGPDAGQIRSALDSAARSMTTLDVNMGALRTAVAPYPVVKQLHVSTGFPHRMRIQVTEQVPVAVISTDGQQTSVSADGTILHDVTPAGSLPTIALDVAPGGTHVSGAAMSEIRLLAAAPYALLAKVAGASSDPTHGLVAQLRNGPKVYFGAGENLAAKWAAAAAVLADPGSGGADYIDVTDPSRPAAGAGPDTAANASGPSGQATSQGTSTGG